MELPDREKRELDEIEQRLAEDDPKLAARLTRVTPAIFLMSRRTLLVLGALATYIAGLLVVIAGVTLSSTVLVALGTAMIVSVFAGLVAHAWRNRHEQAGQ